MSNNHSSGEARQRGEAMKPYRGLTKEGEWVYGWHIVAFGKHYIYEGGSDNWEGKWGGEGTTHDLLTMLLGFVEVLPETVGQSTGLQDKNGKELDWYKGDLFKHHYCDYPLEIVFEEGCIWFQAIGANVRYLPSSLLNTSPPLKKIGDIHTTPELMEAKQ